LYIVVVAMRPWPGSSGSCSRFPAGSELGPVHMQNCISMISRKERQVLGKKSVGAIFFSNSQLEPIMATRVDDSKVHEALSLAQFDC
jgi:hypothetical protein